MCLLSMRSQASSIESRLYEPSRKSPEIKVGVCMAQTDVASTISLLAMPPCTPCALSASGRRVLYEA